MIHSDVTHILRLQTALVATVALLGLIFGKPPLLSLSILLGGAIGVLSAMVYARIAYANCYVEPARLMRAHFNAEAVKFLCTVIGFSLVLVTLKGISVAGLFGGYVAAVAGYWFALLIQYKN